MKLVRLRAPGALENLELVEDDQPELGRAKCWSESAASSLKFHDDIVVHRKSPAADRRVPLSDGAGDVVAVGDPGAVFNQIRISGISIGGRDDQEDMVRAIGLNGLKPVSDGSFPLQEITAAFKHYESQRISAGSASNFETDP